LQRNHDKIVLQWPVMEPVASKQSYMKYAFAAAAIAAMFAAGPVSAAMMSYSGENMTAGWSYSQGAAVASSNAGLASWLPDDGTERGGRADPPEGHAGDPDNARGMRRMVRVLSNVAKNPPVNPGG
jgi:hypothetical protein